MYHFGVRECIRRDANRKGWLGYMKIRLHQFLSKSGVFASKKMVKDAIWKGNITVNGSMVKDIAFQFNPAKKAVCYMGQELTLPENQLYYVLNKPKGFICSRLNEEEKGLGKKSVYQLFEDSVGRSDYDRLVTVGRLDEDTTGFLLVTTDGKVVHNITSPEQFISKTYLVETLNPISQSDADQIERGVKIHVHEPGSTETYTTRPAHVQFVTDYKVLLTIQEGKKRQIRRMFSHLNNEVTELHRTSTERMELSNYNLEFGQFRAVSEEDIFSLILV